MIEGQASQVALSYICQPKPEINWYHADGRKPVDCPGISFDQEGNLAILKVSDAKMSMTGMFSPFLPMPMVIFLLFI